MIMKAYAKINIGLSILFKRNDNYHELESIMVSVDLYDELEFLTNTLNNVKVNCNLKFINYKTNLVYIIAKYLKKEYNIKSGVTINIKKNIPVSGGMAGGSSDAAATIKGLNQLWNLELSEKKMQEIGAKFGADISFCIFQKPAFISGIGEIIEPFIFEPDFNVIVVEMPFGLSTKTIFDNIEFSNLPIYNIKKIQESLMSNNRENFIKYLGNNMEEVSIQLKPEIAEMKKLLISLGCFTSLMSGSGPSTLGFVDNNINADNIVIELKKLGFNAFYTKIIV